LQHALTGGLVEQRDEGTDALDRLTARLSSTSDLEPIAGDYIAEQAVVTGGPSRWRPRPLAYRGSGILWPAWVWPYYTCVPGRSSSLGPATEIRSGAQFGATFDPSLQSTAGSDWDGRLGRDLDALELMAVNRSAPARVEYEPILVTRVARVGVRLAGGLKAVPVDPVPLVVLLSSPSSSACCRNSSKCPFAGVGSGRQPCSRAAPEQRSSTDALTTFTVRPARLMSLSYQRRSGSP